MATTQIINRTVGEFVQPEIGEVVFVRISAMDSWKVGMFLHLTDAGVYEISELMGSYYYLRLKSGLVAPGELVGSCRVFAVDVNGERSTDFVTIRASIMANTDAFMDDRLIGAWIEGMIFVDNSAVDYVKDGVEFDDNLGILNFGAIGGLYAGSNIVITITK